MSEAEKDERSRLIGATAQLAEEPDYDAVDEPLEPVTEEIITEERVVMSPRQAVPVSAATEEGEEDDDVPLWSDGQPEAFRSRWMNIQTGFVDDPRNSVAEADELVDQTIKDLTGSLAGRRSALRGEWDRNSELSTEELRIAMKRYRAFFNQLTGIES